MRSPLWSSQPFILGMVTSTVLLGTGCWACGQEALPGSTLSLPRAKTEAHFIVVARVGKTGDILPIPVDRGSTLMWTELKPSAVLKGEICEEELNRLPLSIQI